MSTTSSQTFADLDALQPGDLVEHPKWGIGSIITRSGQGEHTKLVVAFPEADGNGQKKLLARAARLRKIEDSKPASAPEPVAEEQDEDVVEVEKAKPAAAAAAATGGAVPAAGAAEGEEEEEDDDDDDLLPLEVDEDDEEDLPTRKKADDWEEEPEE